MHGISRSLEVGYCRATRQDLFVLTMDVKSVYVCVFRVCARTFLSCSVGLVSVGQRARAVTALAGSTGACFKWL